MQPLFIECNHKAYTGDKLKALMVGDTLEPDWSATLHLKYRVEIQSLNPNSWGSQSCCVACCSEGRILALDTEFPALLARGPIVM